MVTKPRIVVPGGWYHVLNRGNRRDAIRWLHMAYRSAFNWAHWVRSHLSQGGFRSVQIEDGQGVGEVARYLHPNPVRVRGLGLGKAERK